MDELELLREYGESTPLPSAADLAPTRAKLVTAMRRRRRIHLPAWGWGGVAVAAGVAVAVVAWPAVAPVNQVAPAQADPVQILHNAAAAALKVPDTSPRPDQFIYTKVQHGARMVGESWLSVDGTHDGLTVDPDGTRTILAGCRNGRARVIKGDKIVPNKTDPCTPFPGYLANLPTTADAMTKYLTENKSGVPGDMHAMFKDVDGMIQRWMSPRARAALYEAASRIPGVRAVRDVKDAAGRPGIGIKGPQDRDPVIVFDTTTYVYLGDTESDAVLATAVVDKVEQRP